MNLVHLIVRGAVAVRIRHLNFVSYTNETDDSPTRRACYGPYRYEYLSLSDIFHNLLRFFSEVYDSSFKQ